MGKVLDSALGKRGNMLVMLLLPEALRPWIAVSARGIVVEGIAKRAIRGVSRSCYGSEQMRGGGLEQLN